MPARPYPIAAKNAGFDKERGGVGRKRVARNEGEAGRQKK